MKARLSDGDDFLESQESGFASGRDPISAFSAPQPSRSASSSLTLAGSGPAGFGEELAKAVRSGRLSRTQKAPLAEAFAAGGPEHAKTALEACTQIMKDHSEPTQTKIAAIRALDMLMEVKGDFLAIQVVSQIKFFSQAAKNSKERSPDKRRPSWFPTHTDPAEVAQFLAAVCEFLDKWGRRFENEGTKSSLYTFVKVRQQLRKDGVALPSPDTYQYVQGPNSALHGDQGAGVGLATIAEELEESSLEALLEELAAAARRHGPLNIQTADARARCESLLGRWQAAAAQAAEDGDFGEYERLSTVAHRTAQRLQQDEPLPPDPSMPPSAVAPPETTGPLETREGGGSSGSRGHKSDKSSRKRKSQKSDSSGFGAVGGGFSDFGADWSGAASPSAGFNVGPAAWPASAEFPGAGAVFSDASASQTPTGFPPPQPPVATDMAPFPAPAPPPLEASRSRAAAAEGGDTAASSKSEDESASDAAGCAQLEARVQILQANNAQLQAELRRARKESGEAWQRLQQSGYGQANHSDALASLANMRETNSQLQREVDQLRQELRVAHARRTAAEEKLVERDEQLSDTRERLFHAKKRISHLEVELQSREAAHSALQGRQRDERSRYQATEKELLRAQFALGRMGRHCQEEELVPTRTSVPYGGNSAESPAAHVAVLGFDDTFGGSSSRKVNQHDELAGSVPGASGNSDHFGQHAEAPLQGLARRHRETTFVQARVDGWTAAGDVQADVGTDVGCGAAAPSQPPRQLARSPAEVWARTPRTSGPPSVLSMRNPPATPECVERTCANFRRLLVNRQGPLYEDDHVVLELSVAPGYDSGSQGCTFEATVSNRGSQTLHLVSLVPMEATDSGGQPSVRLRIEVDHKAASGGLLLPRQRLLFRGRLEVLAPFELAPQAELSYLLHDNLCSRARFRLPLTVARLMQPIQVTCAHFLELWGAPEFLRAEVAFVCSARQVFLEAGGLFLLAKCLELGGCLQPMSGVDEQSNGLVLAGSFPRDAAGASEEVLVRAELGGPRDEARGLCRVAVRSGSYVVNRGLAHTFLDLLCDPGCLPVAAA